MIGGPFEGLSIAQTQAIAARRRRAQHLGLALDSSLEVIEEEERNRGIRNTYGPETSGPPPDIDCGNNGSEEENDSIIGPEPLPLEKEVQAEVRRRFTEAGCQVWWLSQARRPGQTAGVPDLWVFHEQRRMAFWFECKRPGGQLSPAQVEFRDLCAKTRTFHVSGGVAEAEIAIARWGLRP